MSDQENQESSKDQQTNQDQPTQNTQPEVKKQITKVVKEKNPKRVAAGKRLAEYSKAAKAKLLHPKQNLENQSEPTTVNESEEAQSEAQQPQGLNTMTILTGVGVLTGLVCLYYTYKQDKRSESNQVYHTTDVLEPHIPTNKPTSSNTPKSRLRSFD